MEQLNIGFTGGCIEAVLGTDSDMQIFFDCIQYYVVDKYPDNNWSLLMDRLYRRYLRLNELDEAQQLMDIVEAEFKQLSKEAIDWDPVKENPQMSSLDYNQKTLYDIFIKYFTKFIDCKESAQIMYKKFKSFHGYNYQAVKIILTNIPWSVMESERPLEEYDTLGADEPPFWKKWREPNNI